MGYGNAAIIYELPRRLGIQHYLKGEYTKRFWAKVLLPDENGCMIWTAYKKPSGYGQFNLNGKTQRAHRISLIVATGEDFPELDAAHAPEVCHNRACVAPNHLRWATRKENQGDRIADGTSNSGERHGMAKLSDSDALQIRQRYIRGKVTQIMLADEYGVTQQQISNILRRD